MPHVDLLLLSVVGEHPKGRAPQGAQASSACVHIVLVVLCGALALWLSLQISFGPPGSDAPSCTLSYGAPEKCGSPATLFLGTCYYAQREARPAFLWWPPSIGEGDTPTGRSNLPAIPIGMPFGMGRGDYFCP